MLKVLAGLLFASVCFGQGGVTTYPAPVGPFTRSSGGVVSPTTTSDSIAIVPLPANAPSNTLAASVIYSPHGSLNVRAFGALGDGTTDDSAAIQAAADSSITRIYAPSGQYRLKTAINLTNRGGNALGGAKPLEIFGDGGSRYGYNSTNGSTAGGTVFICDTGSVCFDTTGSQHAVFRNLLVCASTECMNGSLPTPGKVAFLVARSTASPFAQMDELDQVSIFMRHAATATGLGTLGIYDVAGEHLMVNHSDIVADTPALIAATDRASFPSPFQGALAGPASMTVVEINQSNFSSWESAGLDIYDTGTLSCNDCYFNKIGGTAWAAVRLTGVNASINVRGGQIETYAGALELDAGSTQSLRFTPTIVSPNASGLILVGGAATLDQPDISISSRFAAGTVQMLVNFGSLAVTGGRITLNGDSDVSSRKQQINDVLTTFSGTVIHSGGGASDTVTAHAGSVYHVFTPTGVAIGGGSATKLACYKSDGKTMGFATMAAGDISACN